MADWNKLREALAPIDRSVTWSWQEIDDIVEGLPPAASRQRAWWSGNRAHVTAWRLAGFAVTNVTLGQSITFTRMCVRVEDVVRPDESRPHGGRHKASDAWGAPVGFDLIRHGAPSILLVDAPHRGLSRASRIPCWELSVDHGLVEPGMDPGFGRRRLLADTAPTYRAAWAAWVVARLELLNGTLRGHVVEVAADATCVEVLSEALTERGSMLVESPQDPDLEEVEVPHARGEVPQSVNSLT